MARILIAEPSAEIRELLQHLVTRLGHVPLIAGESADGDAFDAVVAEPAMGGLGWARRARERDPDVPIVFVSIEPASSEARALNPAAYLMKPFGRCDFERALAKAVPS